MESHRNADLALRPGRPHAAVSAGPHRFLTPVVHELTPREIARQRDLVQMSLLPRRQRHITT